MKEKLFAIAIGVVSMLFMYSCESEMPNNNGVTPPPANAQEINEWIYELVSKNYPWDVKSESEVDFTLHPQDFLKSLVRTDDEDAWVAETEKLGSSTRYDIGFEYAANRYQDGKIYYVIYYVKKDSDAEDQGLRRGYLVTTVNNRQPQTLEEAETLLSNAVQEGQPINLVVMNPSNLTSASMTVRPQALDENPIYVDNATNPETVNGYRVGYLMYNYFNPSYDNQLLTKLNQFVIDNINILVLDLRYNNGGSYQSSIYLGSALVKNRNTSDIFMVYKAKDDSQNIQKPFVDAIGSTTIPTLGNRLDRIYILTGQYTSSISEAFINALKAYRGSELILVGENTLGKNGNIVLSEVVPNPELKNTPKGEWSFQIPIATALNKDAGVSSEKYSFENGFSTDLYVVEVNRETSQILGELGDPRETLYKAVLDDLNGRSANRSVMSNDNYRVIMPSSLLKNRKENMDVIHIDDLK